VAGTLAELQRLASEVGTDFLRVSVRAEGPTPGLADEVRELLENALEVTVDYPRQQTVAEVAGESRRTLQPAELFARFYEARNGALPAEELRKLFEEVYEEAHG
jgi:hypothetical protein